MKRTWVILTVVSSVLVLIFLLDLLQGESHTANPDWSRTVTDQTGRELVYVEWDGGTGFVPFTESSRGDPEIQIRVDGDAVHLDWISTSTYVVAGVIGLLLGFVVDLSLRGHGYVRGTGMTGETPDLEVGEERGFYWRT